MKEYLSAHSLICFILGLFIGSLLHCSQNIKLEENATEQTIKEVKENDLSTLSADQYDFIRYNDKTSLFFNKDSIFLVESEKNKLKEYLSLFASKSIEAKISSYCDKSEDSSLGQKRLDSVKKELDSVETIKEENNCSKVYPNDDRDTLNRKVSIKITNK